MDRPALAELVRRLAEDRSARAEREMLVTLYETAYSAALLHAEAEGDFCHAG